MFVNYGRIAYEAYRQKLENKSLISGQQVQSFYDLPKAIKDAWESAGSAVEVEVKNMEMVFVCRECLPKNPERKIQNQSQETGNGLLTLRALSNRLRIPFTWLKTEAAEGRIPCLRIGRILFFNLEAVESELSKRARSEVIAKKTEITYTMKGL